MAKYIFEGDYKNKSGNVQVNLLLIHFEDENLIHFVYSPHLDLTGYGNNLQEAKDSFQIAFEDFIDYTLENKTLNTVLMNLGWDLKNNFKKQKKIIAPSFMSLAVGNKYISELFDNYSVNTYHQEVGIPAFV